MVAAADETNISISRLLALIPLLPLLGALLNGLGTIVLRNRLPKTIVSLIGVGSIALSFLLALICALKVSHGQTLVTPSIFTWIDIGGLKVDVRFLLDPLSVVMVLIVTGVSTLIHVYSVGYMSHDNGYARYFSYLNLFVFAMLLLVLGDNFLLMFVGWEGVGVCSYLLIGFWFSDMANAKAGMKAFVVNRIGDFGFLLGLFLLYSQLPAQGKTFVFRDLEQVLSLSGDLVSAVGGPAMVTAICLLLFVGAVGKSAQIPLYVWLPDAMAGPTPVSALIHAATMVTAGVYMIARCSFLFSASPTASTVIAATGAITAVFAGTIALTQNDIKKVLAYSTVSQLGYMFMGVGAMAYAAGIFHLMTHAFFKACLFLGSGSVIHAMSGEQDIRKMGGLRTALPITFWTMVIATAALAGFPLTAGFFSKDDILWQIKNADLISGHNTLYLLGMIGAGLTAIYMVRLIVKTFFGGFRGTDSQREHLHESPATMTVPLVILATLSIIGGWVGFPHFFHIDVLSGFWEYIDLFPVVSPAEGAAEVAAKRAFAIGACYSLVVLALGVVLFYRLPDRVEEIRGRFSGLEKLLTQKYYVDQLYDRLLVKPLVWLSEQLFWHRVDDRMIDGVLVNGSAKAVRRLGELLRPLQNGIVQRYALAITIGLFILLAYFYSQSVHV